MHIVNVAEAKSTLSMLLGMVEQGDEVVIARNGVKIARLVPIVEHADRRPGEWLALPGWEGFSYRPDMLAPLLTDEELAEQGWI